MQIEYVETATGEEMHVVHKEHVLGGLKTKAGTNKRFYNTKKYVTLVDKAIDDELSILYYKDNKQHIRNNLNKNNPEMTIGLFARIVCAITFVMIMLAVSFLVF